LIGDDLELSAFDIASARLAAVRRRAGGGQAVGLKNGPGLPGARNGRSLRLNRRPSGGCRIKSDAHVNAKSVGPLTKIADYCFFGPSKAALGGNAMLKLSLSVVLVALGSVAYAADARGDFIATWASSPQSAWGTDWLGPVRAFLFSNPRGVPRNLSNQTLREVATISQGGKQVRLVLSNVYGTTPLPIAAAHVALAGDAGAIQTGSDRPVTFDGQPNVVIPPGAEWISDPVTFPVDPLSKLAVSLYFASAVPVTTTHWYGLDTAYITDGNTVSNATIKPSSTMRAKPILTGILVDAPADAKAVVTFGDSITDGDGSKVDQTHRWPDFLAKRLVQARMPMTVVNEGISGSRVLTGWIGVNSLARFDHDVLAQPRASTVILNIGINDIGLPQTVVDPNAKEPTAKDITDGYHQLIERAHAHGLRILGATLTPFEETTFMGRPFEGYFNPDKEKIRAAVNDWIRTSGEFDGVIDFDALVRDPARPSHIKAEYNSGDNLHPNDAANEAMAGSIDLGMLKGNK
jgi:lysophospholipase L1-like esterase